MKFCNECGAKNDPQATACSECGAVLANETEKKSGVSTKTIIAIVAIIAVAAVAVFGGVMLFGNKEEMNPLMNVEAQLAMMRGSDTSLSMSLEFGDEKPTDPQMAMVATMLEDASITITSQHNLNDAKFAFSFDVNVMSQSFLSGKAIVDEKGIVIDAPVMYDQAIYLSWEKLAEEMKAQGQADFEFSYDDVKAYMAVLDFEDTAAYKAIDMDKMAKASNDLLGTMLKETGKEDITVVVDGKEMTVKTTAYDMTMDFENYMTKAVEFSKDIYTDEKVIAFIKDRGNAIVDIAEARGHISGDELAKAKAMLSDDSIDKAMQEMVDQMDTSAIDSSQFAELETMMKDFTIKLYADSDNVTRKQVMKMKLPKEAGIDATVVIDMTVNDYGKNVKVPSADASNALDILSLSEAEQMQLMLEIQNNIMMYTQSMGLGF